MALRLAAVATLAVSLVTAQQIGKYTPDVHPQLSTYKCTKAGGCVAQNTSVVIDSAYRWTHTVDGYDSCTTNSGLNSTLCPDAATCAKNCALEGANYTSAGITTVNDSITLDMYVGGNGVSPRVYLLGDDGNYVGLKLVNQELAFDVDVSKLPCGMNGALYLSEMDLTGGRSDLNPAGASLGTGYCDAQCPVPNFINGVANTNSSGACCNEMDIWEANSASTAFTPHTCNVTGVYQCSGGLCGHSGVCDKDGCGFNAYAQGAHSFYAKNGTVNTSRPFTVVTQFISSTNTSSGALSEIRRLYVQDGKVIANAKTTSGVNSITDAFCGTDIFEQQGGLKGMGDALQRGMVLIFSIWNDAGQFMNWLDSGSSGPCNATEGSPATIEATTPGTAVTWSNVKWGDIGSTYSS